MRVAAGLDVHYKGFSLSFTCLACYIVAAMTKTVYELAKLVYEAKGRESPRLFIIVCSCAGAILFGMLGMASVAVFSAASAPHKLELTKLAMTRWEGSPPDCLLPVARSSGRFCLASLGGLYILLHRRLRLFQ